MQVIRISFSRTKDRGIFSGRSKVILTSLISATNCSSQAALLCRHVTHTDAVSHLFRAETCLWSLLVFPLQCSFKRSCTETRSSGPRDGWVRVGRGEKTRGGFVWGADAPPGVIIFKRGWFDSRFMDVSIFFCFFIIYFSALKAIFMTGSFELYQLLLHTSPFTHLRISSKGDIWQSKNLRHVILWLWWWALRTIFTRGKLLHWSYLSVSFCIREPVLWK